MEINECLHRGAIGAIGAIPGTLLAHPFDLIKIRQQVGGVHLPESARTVMAGGLYRGVAAGVAQKVTTRGPMFLLSEASTQLVQLSTGWSRDRAIFFGSACSGYLTGLCAAPAEWAKVQRGTAAAGGNLRLMLQRRGAVHRLHGAGLRNAVFDSTFFVTEHAARTQLGAPSALSFGGAAALAVAIDFPLDAAVKGSMAAGPEKLVQPPLAATMALLRERRANVFLGLTAKACEFAVSYAVTGQCSAVVRGWLEG